MPNLRSDKSREWSRLLRLCQPSSESDLGALSPQIRQTGIEVTNIIETDRLILRPLVYSDAEVAYYGWTGDPEVAEYVSWLPHHSLAETAVWLKDVEWRQDGEANTALADNYIWGFVLKETGELFGSGGLIWEESWRLYQLGYNIMKKYWNRGYTTEAMRAILRYAALTLGIRQVLGGHAKENCASGRVLEKLGFVYQKDSIQPHIDGQRFFDSKDYLLDLSVIHIR